MTEITLSQSPPTMNKFNCRDVTKLDIKISSLSYDDCPIVVFDVFQPDREKNSVFDLIAISDQLFSLALCSIFMVSLRDSASGSV